MATLGQDGTTIKPLFLLNNVLPAFDKKLYSTSEICCAAEKVSGFQSIIGAQKIGGLWRIYSAHQEGRTKLLIQGILLRGVKINLRDSNPFAVINPDGSVKEVATTKVIIGNIPMSLPDEEVIKPI